MRTIGRLSVAVLAGALACASVPAAAESSQERRGERLLERHCAMCHATGKIGGSAHAKAPPFRVLGQRYAIESLEESLVEGLMSGHPDMPEFSFSPQDAGAIIAYLKSIQSR